MSFAALRMRLPPASATPAPILRRRLTIGRVDDPLESAADRLADAALTGASRPLAIGAAAMVRRGAPGADEPAHAPESVDRLLARPGTPLDPAVRHDMEARFGHDFSHVRVHSDAAAARSASDIAAAAYTAGNHVVFGADRFDPGSGPGRHLLAHELAHVVQQGGGDHRVQRQPLGEGGLIGGRQAELLWESYRQSFTLSAFKSDSAEPTPEHLASLKEYKERLATLLGRYPDSFVTVTGHTDATDSETHNAKLGQERADAVRKELTTGDFAVSADLVSSGSLGETALAVDTKGREPLNRRVTIMPTLRRNFRMPELTPPPPPAKGDFTIKTDINIGPPYRPPPDIDTTKPTIPKLDLPQRNWLEDALKKDELIRKLPDFARDKVIDALKDADEKLAEKIIDGLPLDGPYKAAVQAIAKALLQGAKGKKFKAPEQGPGTLPPQPPAEFQKLPGQQTFPLKTWEF